MLRKNNKKKEGEKGENERNDLNPPAAAASSSQPDLRKLREKAESTQKESQKLFGKKPQKTESDEDRKIDEMADEIKRIKAALQEDQKRIIKENEQAKAQTEAARKTFRNAEETIMGSISALMDDKHCSEKNEALLVTAIQEIVEHRNKYRPTSNTDALADATTRTLLNIPFTNTDKVFRERFEKLLNDLSTLSLPALDVPRTGPQHK